MHQELPTETWRTSSLSSWPSIALQAQVTIEPMPCSILPLPHPRGGSTGAAGKRDAGFAASVSELMYSIKNWMGPCQRTPKEVARAIRFSGLGVRSVGPVGDFLDVWQVCKFGGDIHWNCHVEEMPFMPDFFCLAFSCVFGKEIPMKTFSLHIAIRYVQIYVNDDMTYNRIELLWQSTLNKN